MDTERYQIHYPQATMYDMIDRAASEYPDAIAYELFGRKTSFRAFNHSILRVAKAFVACGIGRDDKVTICMPNSPQAIDCFYALNRIGAVANMIHPQSAESEITFYLTVSESKMILVLDMFYEKVVRALAEVPQPVTVLVARLQDSLPLHLGTAFLLKEGRKYLKYPGAAESTEEPRAMLWRDFLKAGEKQGTRLCPSVYEAGHTAVILYSGGTSGSPKGICLTDLNFNALAMEARVAMETELGPGRSILACMPMFHGFGLGINIHTILFCGATCILMPSFDMKTYARMLKSKNPNFIAGVPTIFEALLHMKELDGVDMSFLKGMFCGGDSLTVELKKKIDAFLHEHNARIQVREGYGLTECVTASCLTPKATYREGSIGLPFPDIHYCIVTPGTDEEVPRGTEGEIILRGPTVMAGYLNNLEETSNTLRVLKDGNIWLYTGDLGKMDEDGYVYFSQRIKRMIVSNGYNIYPGRIENVIDSLDEVAYSCVIGVKDPHRMQRVRAYVVLRTGLPADEESIRGKIMETLQLHVAAYALPKEIIFREELPKTLVGKVFYRKLEEEANAEIESRTESR